ncbi:hypothetical protein ACWIDJ_16115, partial [Brevundimonas naejangsanensis]
MAFWTAVAMAAGLVALQPEQAAPQVAPDPEAAQVDDVEVVARMRADQVRERVNAFIESNMAPPLG